MKNISNLIKIISPCKFKTKSILFRFNNIKNLVAKYVFTYYFIIICNNYKVLEILLSEQITGIFILESCPCRIEGSYGIALKRYLKHIYSPSIMYTFTKFQSNAFSGNKQKIPKAIRVKFKGLFCATATNMSNRRVNCFAKVKSNNVAQSS